MKLTITLELPIREEYKGLINIVALTHGYTSGDPIHYVEEYLADKEEAVLKEIIEQSLRTYYGLSQNALINKALSDYDQSVDCYALFDTGVQNTGDII